MSKFKKYCVEHNCTMWGYSSNVYVCSKCMEEILIRGVIYEKTGFQTKYISDKAMVTYFKVKK